MSEYREITIQYKNGEFQIINAELVEIYSGTIAYQNKIFKRSTPRTIGSGEGKSLQPPIPTGYEFIEE